MDEKLVNRLIKNLKKLQRETPYKFKEDESSDDDCGGDN
tara:strand:+ start:134 stop:250 length:117 start_codon:yes stop_codon:yes gene_type:complete